MHNNNYDATAVRYFKQASTYWFINIPETKKKNVIKNAVNLWL